MDTQNIRLDKTDRILTVTLHRPDKLNAFTRAMRDELISAFARADADDDVRVVIVTGADEALAGGLVSRVVAPEELLPAAQQLAREIADHTSAVSVALSRQMLWRMAGADHPMEAHKIDSRAITAMGASADVAEGIASFKEKRAPRFTMRPSKDMPDFYPWWEERPFK